MKAKGSIDLVEPAWKAQGSDYVTALAWSPDGTRLAAAFADGPIHILQGESGRLAHELPGHGMGTLALDWSGDGRWLASGGQDGKARIWNPADGREIRAHDGSSGWVEHIAFSPRANHLATAAGKHVKIWQEDGSLLQAHDDHASTVSGLSWLRNGCELASCCYGGAKLWRLGRKEPQQHFQWKGSFLSLSLSPNEKHLAAGCQDASLFVWNVKTAKNLSMSGYPGKIGLLHWSATSRYLATGAGRDAVLWDFSGAGPADREPLVLSRHVDRIADLRFHPKTALLATAGDDGMVIFWNAAQRSIKDLCILKDSLSRLAWSPIERQLAVGTSTGGVYLLEG